MNSSTTVLLTVVGELSVGRSDSQEISQGTLIVGDLRLLTVAGPDDAVVDSR